jgi:hypothetical protein
MYPLLTVVLVVGGVDAADAANIRLRMTSGRNIAAFRIIMNERKERLMARGSGLPGRGNQRKKGVNLN